MPKAVSLPAAPTRRAVMRQYRIHSPKKESLPARAKVPALAAFLDRSRILATAMRPLRAKIKHRPVIFELTPESFNCRRSPAGACISRISADSSKPRQSSKRRAERRRTGAESWRRSFASATMCCRSARRGDCGWGSRGEREIVR